MLKPGNMEGHRPTFELLELQHTCWTLTLLPWLPWRKVCNKMGKTGKAVWSFSSHSKVNCPKLQRSKTVTGEDVLSVTVVANPGHPGPYLSITIINQNSLKQTVRIHKEATSSASGTYCDMERKFQ